MLIAAEPEAPTDAESDDYIVLGGKRIPSSSLNPRALKRNKEYHSFSEVRPTIRNKPSGLITNWPQVLRKTIPAARRQASPLSPMMSPTPSSMTQMLYTPSSLASSSSRQPYPSPITPDVDDLDLFSPAASIQNTVAPSPFHLGDQHQVHSFKGKYKDKNEKIRSPGVKHLPFGMQTNFRDVFIRHMIKMVCSDVSPWSNPSLPIYQHEFNQVYPQLQCHLSPGDAVVAPTSRDIGKFRNQIGVEGLTAVIEFLPTQYSKRLLDSKAQRAAYINTLLKSEQHPIVWEYFRPGTIEVPSPSGEKYYDEKRRGLFQAIPVIHAFSAYYKSYGIRQPPDDTDRPIGALALAAAAVERGYRAHKSGDYVSTLKDFSTTNCLKSTTTYANKIKKHFTDDDWKGVFNALRRYERTRAHEAQVDAGISVDESAPFLPADPPSSPSN